jgi:hypothetical protein
MRSGRRSLWLYASAGAAVMAILAVGIVVLVVLRHDADSQTAAELPSAYNALPGIRRTDAPWSPDYEFLADRLAPLGLNTLAREGTKTHVHAHLDIFVNRKRVLVPALIGINRGAAYYTELHTHDTRGVIHIESPESNASFTLGQFVAEWGVFLNSRCMGAYCGPLKWYVNGKRRKGNPQALVLEERQEIAIVVGKPPRRIPASYAFRPYE